MMCGSPFGRARRGERNPKRRRAAHGFPINETLLQAGSTARQGERHLPRTDSG